MEAQLIRLFDASPDDLVLNLGVSFQDSNDWSKQSGDGWIGIYVRKTANGYLRMWSHELYVSGKHNRVRCPRTVLYIRKDISHYDIALLQKQYDRAIQLDLHGLPAGATIVQTHPVELWDPQKGLFLDPGAGLNIYCEIEVSLPESPRPFRLLVACSTMEVPTCVIWTDQDHGLNDVQNFLSQAKDITDYAAVDYLVRDLIPTKKCYLKESIVVISTEYQAKCWVTLLPAMIEGSDGFCFRIFSQLRYRRG
tara:strand:- start:1249 stop:2001 length:753 start_codon:yes stop_codon:yes gene_type:complete